MKRANSNYLGSYGPILGNPTQENTGNPLAEDASEKLDLINMLQEELILTIFEKCKTALPALASVNKYWKQITETKAFFTAMFSPAFASCGFGKADLQTHFGMNLGPDEVPHLRLKDYGDIEKGICLLTYFPKEIPIEDKDGVISWVPPNAKIIGELVKNPKCGYATSFIPESVLEVINEEREIKGGKWVVTYKEPIGHDDQTFGLQILSALNQGEGTDVAEFEKTIYAVFMHYVKTGERCFIQERGNYPLIRFKEKVYGKRIIFGFEPQGLGVYRDLGFLFQTYCVAVARESIGPCILGTKTHLTQEG